MDFRGSREIGVTLAALVLAVNYSPWIQQRLLSLNAAQAASAQAGQAEERVLILCDALPDEPFSTPKALGRNHTIYALGRAALVVAAREGHGGSWHGATDCLHGGFAPVYVWNGDNEDTTGNRALHALGAKPYDLSGRETLSEQLGLL